MRQIRKMARWLLGDFHQGKSPSMTAVGIIMGIGMGLRHGGPERALMTVAGATLMWCSHRRMRGSLEGGGAK